MPIEWSGLGPELLLTMDRDDAEPLRAQLERQLRDAIRDGRLAVGERLPSSRELARELGLSRGLVQECYAQLQAEGYLVTRVGSATRVAAGAVPPAGRARPGPGRPRGCPPISRPACRIWPASRGPTGRGRCARRAGWFRTPISTTATRGAVRSARGAGRLPAPGPGRRGGPGPAPRLHRLRAGARPGAPGAGAGRDPPDRVRGPGLLRRRTAAAATAGLRAVPVPVDDRASTSPRSPRPAPARCVLTPAHQWPTGVVLAAERRLQLVDWAAERDAVIIEDDYDAEFRYDREPVGALQGLAAGPGGLASARSASRWPRPCGSAGSAARPRWPGRSPRRRRRTIAVRPGSTSSRWPPLIESGRYDRHLRRMRAVYARPARRAGRRPGAQRPGGPADRPRGRIPRGRAPARPVRRGGGDRGGPGPLGRPLRDERPVRPARSRQPRWSWASATSASGRSSPASSGWPTCSRAGAKVPTWAVARSAELGGRFIGFYGIIEHMT